MSTTLKSVAGSAEATVHIRTSGIDSPPQHVHLDIDGTDDERAACFSVDRTELAATLAKEADFSVVDNRDLPEVNEKGATSGGWGWIATPDWTRERIIEQARANILHLTAVLRWNEQKLAEESKKAELDAIERFVAENGGTWADDSLIHALHEKGFRP